MNYESDVHMVHFSGKLKPAHWMFDTASDRGTYEEFVNSTMVNQFLTVLERERASKDKAAGLTAMSTFYDFVGSTSLWQHSDIKCSRTQHQPLVVLS
jgi:hypothetical protein